MIISHSRRFVLFCNPGTGTGPLLRLLQPWAEEPVVEYRNCTPDAPFYHIMPPVEAAAAFAARGWEWDSYRRVTLVMNPYPRLQALYRRIADSDPGWAARRRAGSGQPRFCDWVRGTKPHGNGAAGGTGQPPWRRLGSWSAQVWCDGLVTDAVPTESQGQRLPRILADHGIDAGDVPPPVPDPGTFWDATFDEPTALLVARRYGADLAAWGWSHPVLDWAA